MHVISVPGTFQTSSKWEASSPLLALRPVLALNLSGDAVPPVNQILYGAQSSQQPVLLVSLVLHLRSISLPHTA